MRRTVVVIGVVLLEATTAVVVSLATGRSHPWLWLVLAALVVTTCGVAWWREHDQDRQSSVSVSVRARPKGTIERTPVEISRTTDASVRIEAESGGSIKDSGVRILSGRERPGGRP